MVGEAPSRAASRQQPFRHDRLHHVYVRTVVDVLAVRPLQVRNGVLVQSCGHIGQFVAAVCGMPLEGPKETRLTIVDASFLRAPVRRSAACQSSSEHWKADLRSAWLM